MSGNTIDAAVREYYARCAQREAGRLVRESGALEFALTTRAMGDYLSAGSRVLDLGGGPGCYTVWLGQRGHRIVLVDISPELLAIARERIARAGVEAQVERVCIGDARDLSSWADGSFDAVVALGPFYHLVEPAHRDRAAAEIRRILKPDGLVFAAWMPRLGIVRRAIGYADENRHLRDTAATARWLEDGVFINDIPDRFTGCYGARPDEIVPFFARHGFAAIRLLAAEGITPGIEDALTRMAASDPQAHAAAMELIFRTADDPSILGIAGHLLYIGRRSGSAPDAA